MSLSSGPVILGTRGGRTDARRFGYPPQRSAPEVGRGAQSKKFKIKSRLSDDDEAGFSDYNPFQSGGGDSPMPVPLKERKKRKVCRDGLTGELLVALPGC